MSMVSTSEFRKGLKVEMDGNIYEIVDFEHHKPGKGSAVCRTRFKNLKDGRTLDKTFRSGDKIAKADFEEQTMQFLYIEGENFHFMNNKSYEQIELQKDFVGDAKDYLLENLEVSVLFHNQRPITIELPNFVNLKITYTEPGYKGDTATGATKPATLETGKVIYVPLFMKEGDVLKIDTRTGEYVERVNK